jgi:hypothetical protein
VGGKLLNFTKLFIKVIDNWRFIWMKPDDGERTANPRLSNAN